MHCPINIQTNSHTIKQTMVEQRKTDDAHFGSLHANTTSTENQSTERTNFVVNAN